MWENMMQPILRKTHFGDDMAVTAKTRPSILTKPPILEAIFEMRWNLAPVPNSQIRRDPSYPLLYGRLYDRFRKDYALVEDLPSAQAHPDASPYVVRHRMRKAADQWPLVQIGPGVITVNEGTKYGWDQFRGEIVRIFEAFTDFYPASTFPLNIVKTELRWINGIQISEKENPLQFMADKLHTKIELDSALFASGKVCPAAQAVMMNVGFDIQEPVGKAMLGIGSGEVADKPAILQQMMLQSLGDDAPQDFGALDPWLDSMHSIAKDWFEVLCRGDVMKQFA
jgi:uncharacterized protein (TIGR04255 family)